MAQLEPRYYSTNMQTPEVSFKQAILQGQAPDRGLYMPKFVPAFQEGEVAAFREMEYPRMAFEIMRKYISRDEVSDAALEAIVQDAYDFEVPIERVTDDISILRLDRGPTASFKDFAARALGRLMAHFLEQEDRTAIILTATSGDTGGAVADAFYRLDRVNVVVLYPRNEVSDRQRRQMTTLGENVTAIGVRGKFDDCQRMVKEAFADPRLAAMGLSSANSINFGRLLPQTVYYCYAWSRVARGPGEQVNICVPSGNFGNLMAGLLALKMGLPVERFIAATNENDEFPRYLETGEYEKIEPSRNCLSNAMNVGHPSNLARIIALYGGVMDERGTIREKPDLTRLRGDIFSTSVNDAETRRTIKQVYETHGTLLEPHGAVGWKALRRFKEAEPNQRHCITLETADPAKFPTAIRELVGIDPPMPAKMAAQQQAREFLHEIPDQYEAFRAYLLDEFQ